VLRGSDNPFSRPEIKAKVQAYWQRHHGVDGPQQVAGIRAKTKATMLTRYHGELLGSSELKAKAEATNLERYGVAYAGGTPGVQAKVKATNMERYGVPHTCMDPDVRRRQLETMEEHYGSSYFASEEGKREIRAVMLERYGVEFPGAMEGHWDKVVATFQERYGVDHPLQLPEMREKQANTNMLRYGWRRYLGTPGFCRAALKNAGVTLPDELPSHPMQNHEYALKMFQKMHRAGPNRFETRVGSLAPQLVFTGDGGFWRWLPLLGHFKNPDYILPGPDAAHPKRGVTKIVECFGDYWHGRMRTGKAPFDHEQEVIQAFAEVGLECLIVWESEVKLKPEEVKARLRAFLE